MRSGLREIWRVPAAGGASLQVTHGGAYEGFNRGRNDDLFPQGHLGGMLHHLVHADRPAAKKRP